jgi:hypothetical protein
VLAEIWRVMKIGGLMWLTLPTPKGSDCSGPRDQHLMILDDWFMLPCLKTAGFEVSHHVNDSHKYEFLCRKLSMDYVEPYKTQVYRRLEALQAKEKTNG